jgi:hypothetical protein
MEHLGGVPPGDDWEIFSLSFLCPRLNRSGQVMDLDQIYTLGKKVVES